MFGGLYTDGKRVYSTSCHFSYDLSTRTWTYHRRVPPPFQKTGILGGVSLLVRDSLRIEGGFLGRLCVEFLVEGILSRNTFPAHARSLPRGNGAVYRWQP